MTPRTTPASRRKSTPLAWVLPALFAAAMAMLYWYDMPLLMQLVSAVWLTGMAGVYLWRHYTGTEPQRWLGLCWFVFACGVGGFAFTAAGLAGQGS